MISLICGILKKKERKKERKKEKAQTRMYTKKHWWLPQPVGGQNK